MKFVQLPNIGSRLERRDSGHKHADNGEALKYYHRSPATQPQSFRSLYDMSNLPRRCVAHG